MKKKAFLVVPKEKYDEASRLLRNASIPVTSSYGIFKFDLVSFIIGFAIALVFGIVVF